MSFNPRIGTITEEQLKLLGVCNEIFPALLQKPGKLETNPDRDFQIAFKENYSNYLCDCFTSKIDDKSEDYLTKVAKLIEDRHKLKIRAKIAFKLMPAELNQISAQRMSKPLCKSRPNLVKIDINQRLKILEQREKEENVLKVNDELGSNSERETEDEDSKSDDADDNEIDYGSNYFDNGEDYEEDNNLEAEDPVSI